MAEGTSPASVNLEIRPRVQKDKWSLYWKESMETKTETLSVLAMDISPDVKLAELHSLIAAKLAWPALESLERLEGFKDPWETSVYKGRQMKADSTLASNGITSGATITIVRRMLVPEGWRIIEEGQDEDDLSSEEEW